MKEPSCTGWAVASPGLTMATWSRHVPTAAASPWLATVQVMSTELPSVAAVGATMLLTTRSGLGESEIVTGPEMALLLSV